MFSGLICKSEQLGTSSCTVMSARLMVGLAVPLPDCFNRTCLDNHMDISSAANRDAVLVTLSQCERYEATAIVEDRSEWCRCCRVCR